LFSPFVCLAYFTFNLEEPLWSVNCSDRRGESDIQRLNGFPIVALRLGLMGFGIYTYVCRIIHVGVMVRFWKMKDRIAK
jgi:hypothetical protein